MNKLLKSLALLAASFFAYSSLSAQSSLVIITPAEDVISPDTAACHSDPMFINATVTKVGLDSLPISFNLMMQTPLGTFLLDSATVGGPAGDSVTISLVDSFSSARLGGGINVIVIWPEASFFPPNDSVRDTVFIICGSTHTDPGLEAHLITAYPNPSESGHFLLMSKGDVPRSTQVQVRDAAGRLVQQHDTFQREIDLSAMASGVYHLTLIDRQKPPVHIKLFR